MKESKDKPWFDSDFYHPRVLRPLNESEPDHPAPADVRTELDRLARTGKVRDSDLDDVIGLAARAQEE